MVLKKLVFLGFMSAGIAFAGTMGKDETQRWEIGAEALYFKPSLGNFAYFGYTNLAESPQGGQRVLRFIQPSADWGFRLEGKYFFNTSTYIDVNWSTFNNTTKGAHIIDYDSNNGVPDEPIVTRQGVNWNDVRLEMGHAMAFDQTKSFKLHGGLEYSSIKPNTNFYTYNQGTEVTPNTSNEFATSTRLARYRFEGLGPVVGVDLMYNLMEALQIYTKASSALLLGNSKYSDLVSFTTDPNIVTRNSKLRYAVVPAVMVDLGARYDFDVKHTTFSIDGGWRLYNYINTFVNADTNNFVNPGVNSNFAIQGAYIGLKWNGSV